VLREAARSRARPRTRWLLDAAIVALALAALVPPALMVRQLLAVSRLAREHPRWVPPSARDKAVVEEAARWLRDATPPTRGFLDASLRPEYGVLTPWDYGHLVRYLAERPTVQDNFGSFGDRRAFVLAGRYFEAMDEEAAYEAALEAGARYALVTVAGSGQVVQPSPESVGRRLWRWLGAAGPGSAAFGRHRLVWVEDAPGRPQPRETPTLDRVAVFELVPGALVEGEAPPGARVEAELRLRCGSGHLRYAAVTKAGSDGRYVLRLPYATNLPASPAVSAVGAYRVRTGGRSAALAVPDADVRAGATVAGPNLR
jgi:asparagine N-glycosylation enzyme membrane subunit Stt3